MRKSAQNPLIDQDYFKRKLAEKKLSVRGLAALMGLSPSTVSLMLRGIQGIKNAHQVKLSIILGVNHDEIAEKLGLPKREMPDQVRRLFEACYRTFNVFEVNQLSIDQVSALGGLARALKAADPHGLMRPTSNYRGS